MKRQLLCLLAALLPSLAQAQDQAACPRIVSQSPYITGALNWLGLGDCIVGVSRYEQMPLAKAGGILDPDAEAIAALRPQLIVTSDWTPAEAWQAATPPGAKALRVGGFNSMAEVEAMLRDIGRAAGMAGSDAKADRFAADWRAAAARVGGSGRKALLLSACGGIPYSFGRRTWLYDLFSQAGFDMVETHDKLRHLRPGEPVADLGSHIDALRPDILFVFERKGAPSCNVMMKTHRARVVMLDGEKFLNPGPVLLEGLAQLHQEMSHD